MVRNITAAFVVGLVLGLAAAPASAAGEPDWDRIANVKAAATQIGTIQASQGADKAFEFIVACYRTHGLGATYSKYFESCIAQDFMLMEALTAVYSRVDPETLRKSGSPSVSQLQASLNSRVNSAYATYKLPPADGQALKKIVDTYGMPVFLKIIFPKAADRAAQPSHQPAAKQ